MPGSLSAFANASRRSCLQCIFLDGGSWSGKGGQCGQLGEHIPGREKEMNNSAEKESLVRVGRAESSRRGAVQAEAGWAGRSQTTESPVG